MLHSELILNALEISRYQLVRETDEELFFQKEVLGKKGGDEKVEGFSRADIVGLSIIGGLTIAIMVGILWMNIDRGGLDRLGAFFIAFAVFVIGVFIGTLWFFTSAVIRLIHNHMKKNSVGLQTITLTITQFAHNSFLIRTPDRLVGELLKGQLEAKGVDVLLEDG